MSRWWMKADEHRSGAWRTKQRCVAILRAGPWRVLVPTAVVMAGVTGLAVATIPNTKGVISSCYKVKKVGDARGPSGQLRVIDAQAGAKCAKGEKPLTFNQRGPAGANGKPGPAGPRGVQGAQGAPGGLAPSYRAVNKERYFVDSLAEPNTAVTLAVPAPGTYHVTGKVQVHTPDGQSHVYCSLRVSGADTRLDQSQEILASINYGLNGGSGVGMLPISTIVTLGPGLGSPRTLRIDCESQDEEGYGINATLEAVSVAPPG